ncbi:MAG: gamma carbonic anhydrase family protein [Oligoflexia bacterium]|nr:gamma carbonic anhydrase family protein [Oligoflexia bacterium]
MALIKSIRGIHPKWGSDCYFSENATIIGDVVMGDNCSVWFNAVIRGDVDSIRIGNKTNVQDGTIIHCTHLNAKTIIGNNVTIGHNVVIHGCTIGDNVLIGMGAIIMDNALINSNSVIAAGSVVLENTIVESETIYAGVPAKKIKKMNKDQLHNLVSMANNYLEYTKWYKEEQN